MSTRFCPLMSKPVSFKHDDGSSDIEMFFQDCIERKCQFWIVPYTTENCLMQEGGCSLELSPMMHDGLFRV